MQTSTEEKVEEEQKRQEQEPTSNDNITQPSNQIIREKFGGAANRPLTRSERFTQIAVRLTERPSKYVASRFPGLGVDILKSNLNIAPEGIIAISIFATFLAIPFVAVGTYFLFKAGLIIFAVFLPVALVLPFAFGISAPKVSASSRAANLENELPFLVGYITVLAGGGISPFRTITRIAKADAIFPAAAKEARRILLDIQVFGLDPITAFEKAALYTPNRKFSEFIAGYISVLKTGGDVTSYLQAQLRDIYAHREIQMRSSTETIGTFAETYIIATVVVGVCLFIFFITEALLASGAGTINATTMELFSAVFVPAISIAFIMIVNSAQLKEPFTYYAPYYAFMIAIPIGIAFFFLFPMQMPVYWRLGISLMLISTPAAFINENYTRRRKAVESKLANFMRDISEIRKTGLAPEKTIEQLAGRNYGGLTSHVSLVSNQLSWGIPIRRVMETFSSRVKSYLARAIAFLLLEVVEVGGGSPMMFTGLADFTEKTNQLNKERRSQVRPYVMVPYIGAVLIVITTSLMVSLVGAGGLLAANTAGGIIGNPKLITATTSILFTAAYFQGWVMGIVAGKMGELTVADGFKHATLIVLISLIAATVATIFVKF